MLAKTFQLLQASLAQVEKFVLERRVRVVGKFYWLRTV
jgi:hypothetical protein